jgi:hypothetical protein
MTDILSLIDPVELTEYARLQAADFEAQAQSYAQFLPYKGVDDIQYAYDKQAAPFVDEATFRAYDAESPIGKRGTGARIIGEIPAISRKIPVSEYNQLRLRRNSDSGIVDQVFDDAGDRARGIIARLERARAVLLETGNVAIDENGYTSTYQSGRHASLTVTALAGTNVWSDYDDSKPVTNVLAWCELIRGRVGVSPTLMRVSATVMGHLQQCNEVRGALMPLTLAPARVSRQQVSEAFLAIANVRVEVDETPAGMTSAPRDATKVVLMIEGPVGHTLFGMPLEASEPEYSGISTQPGIYAGVWKEKDPVVPWVKAVAIALPILTIPDGTLSCKVIA